MLLMTFLGILMMGFVGLVPGIKKSRARTNLSKVIQSKLTWIENRQQLSGKSDLKSS